MRTSLLALALLTLPAPLLAQEAPAEPVEETEATEATSEPEAPAPTLDLTLRTDPFAPGSDMDHGAVRITAKLESTQLYLDGEYMGTGTALIDRVMPGPHDVEGRLPSGRKLSRTVFLHAGTMVSVELAFGDQKGEDVVKVVSNVLSMVAGVVGTSINATQGRAAIQTDMPGLVRSMDAISSGDRTMPRP